jgi:CheY-like chemotaxis protein
MLMNSFTDVAVEEAGLYMEESHVFLERGLRILLVDDTVLCRKMSAKHIASICQVCDEAGDGAECVAKVKAMEAQGTPYDAILLDSAMPLMTGPTAARILCDSGFKGKIFGVTGNALKQDVNHFLGQGADKIYIKPLSPLDYDTILSGINCSCYGSMIICIDSRLVL